MALEKIVVPDLGTDEALEVIDLPIKVGSSIEVEEIVLTLESDKATMDIPSKENGVIAALFVNVGDKLKTGSVIAEVEVIHTSDVPSTDLVSEPDQIDSQTFDDKEVVLPDLGTDQALAVIEIFVTQGQKVGKDDDLMTLESDKASMDIPASFDGVIESILVSTGSEVRTGDKVAVIRTSSVANENNNPSDPRQKGRAGLEKNNKNSMRDEQDLQEGTSRRDNLRAKSEHKVSVGAVYAGPSARKLARDLGLLIEDCPGTGKRGRILIEDVTAYAKSLLDKRETRGRTGSSRALPDFSSFGQISQVSLTRIKQKTAKNLLENHLSIPPVTQFEKANISELEKFRQEKKQQVSEQGGKLTMILFVIKALVASLKKYPSFNSSLSDCGTFLIQKEYFHIGVAVDTPQGLVVPVIKDVDTKSILDLSIELTQLSQKARQGALTPKDMQGSSMTISSLGGIGGTAFTPIVNWPDVAILGLSAIQVEPLWNGTSFEPKKMLPLSLSYDHRVIDGAQAARFIVDLKNNLEDLREVMFLGESEHEGN